jgi:hypothetical protein
MYSKDRRANIAFALGEIIYRLGIALAGHFTVDAISDPRRNITTSLERDEES